MFCSCFVGFSHGIVSETVSRCFLRVRSSGRPAKSKKICKRPIIRSLHDGHLTEKETKACAHTRTSEASLQKCGCSDPLLSRPLVLLKATPAVAVQIGGVVVTERALALSQNRHVFMMS